MECGMYGPMTHVVSTPLEGYQRTDEITLGYTNISTQNKRLIAKAICKSVGMANI
jgi:hypothetical protein